MNIFINIKHHLNIAIAHDERMSFGLLMDTLMNFITSNCDPRGEFKQLFIDTLNSLDDKTLQRAYVLSSEYRDEIKILLS